MIMAIPVFLLFLITAVVNVYLPLFLQMMGYSATQIGFLLAFFNAVGIVVPLLGTPLISKSRRIGLIVALLGAGMAGIAWPLFHSHTFIICAVCLSLFAVFYKTAIPLCDSMTNEALGVHRELYGRIRVFGSASFVIMSLVMQKLIGKRQCSSLEMTLWEVIPAVLFTLSVLPLAGVVHGKNREYISSHETRENEQENFIQTLKSFNGEYYLVLFVIFMEYMGMAPANSFLSLYVKNELHSSLSGFLWAFSALCEIPFMFASSMFIRRFKALPLIIVCTAAVTVRMSLYAFIPNLGGAFAGQFMHNLTFGLFYPSAVMYCAQAAKSKRALVVSMSLLNAVSGIANVLGSSIGGVLIDTAGFKALFCIFGVLPLAGIAVFACVKHFLPKLAIK